MAQKQSLTDWIKGHGERMRERLTQGTDGGGEIIKGGGVRLPECANGGVEIWERFGHKNMRPDAIGRPDFGGNGMRLEGGED
jgi:hypothetical protein